MKDFSLFYGPARGWLSAISFAAVALLALLAYQSRFVETPCPVAGAVSATDGACDGGLSGDAEPPVGGTEIEPFSLVSSPSDDDDAAEDPWDRAEIGRDGGDVPFVSLQPSPQPMTDAGRELVRQAEGADS